jgi:hypothetical protein
LFDAAKGNILEIGVRSGVSTSALLAGVEEHGGHLYSVDINPCKVFEGNKHWSFFQVDTQKDWSYLHNIVRTNPIDVLFVDGDHTYDGALYDMLHFGQNTKKIFVHDTDAPDFPGVRMAVEQFVRQTGRKVTYHSGSFGMAEIV